MKAIIYYRKSTDREDTQVISLEHQFANCIKIANDNGFEIVKEIGEARSAKTEGTRPGFNEMIKICKTLKIDYIIIDEPKRLSRNNLDSARIIDLFDKKLIKGIYSTGRIYLADQISDIFMLQLDLSLSKMDNAHRSKDVKEKMLTCVKNQKRFLGRAYFGYDNITINKKKEIIINEKEAKVVKEIFELRAEGKAFKEIGKILDLKYGKTIDLTFKANTICRLVSRKFYYGIFTRLGVEYEGSHKPIITKELYNKANGIGRGVYQEENTQSRVQEGMQRKYPLKGFLRDSNGVKLTAYTKKGKYDYYGHQNSYQERICINQNEVFEKIGEYIKANEIEDIRIKKLDKNIILALIKKEEQEKTNDSKDIENKINELKRRQEDLLDMKLGNKITEELYLLKNNKLEEDIFELKSRKNTIGNEDYKQKIEILLELAGSFYRSYLNLNEEGKSQIVKYLMLELKVNTKKELQVKESPLFESSKMLNFSYGAEGETRTRMRLSIGF